MLREKLKRREKRCVASSLCATVGGRGHAKTAKKFFSATNAKSNLLLAVCVDAVYVHGETMARIVKVLSIVN